MKQIKASEGKYLTQKTIENEGARVFAISLFLADNDNEANWREATQEEYYQWQKQQEEINEQALHGEQEPVVTSENGND